MKTNKQASKWINRMIEKTDVSNLIGNEIKNMNDSNVDAEGDLGINKAKELFVFRDRIWIKDKT